MRCAIINFILTAIRVKCKFYYRIFICVYIFTINDSTYNGNENNYLFRCYGNIT